MATTMPILNFQPEGIRSIEFYFPRAVEDVRLAGVEISEAQMAQIEPLLTSSLVLERRELPAARVDEAKKGGGRLPWKKKGPVLYQITPLVTVALATTAMVFPRTARAGEFSSVTKTPIHHFMQRSNDEIAQSEVTNQSFNVDEPSPEIDDLSLWPVLSAHPTTPASAMALHRATRDDPTPTLPPLVIDDGLGI